MNDPRLTPLTEAVGGDALREHPAALRAIRNFQRLFFTLLILSLLVHIGAYSVAKWGVPHSPPGADAEASVTPGSTDAAGAADDSAVESSGAAAAPSAPAVDAGGASVEDEPTASPAWAGAWFESPMYEQFRDHGLPLTEFVGQLCCGGLLACSLLSTHVCLSAGVGGAAATIGGFFWMLIVWALLFPWGRWLGGVQLPGVYISAAELQSLPTIFADRLDEALHYVRFLGYPVLVVLLVLAAEWRLAAGQRLALRASAEQRGGPAR